MPVGFLLMGDNDRVSCAVFQSEAVGYSVSWTNWLAHGTLVQRRT